MRLFRILYIRNGQLRGMTFAKRNAALAELFAVEVIRPLIASIQGKDVQPVKEVK